MIKSPRDGLVVEKCGRLLRSRRRLSEAVTESGTEREAAVSRYFESYVEDRDAHGTTKFSFAARNFRQSALMFARLLRLPKLTITPSDSLEGIALHDAFGRHHPVSRLIRHAAVVLLPGSADEYCSGSSKQTLRRKIRQAHKLGVGWKSVDDPEERRRVLALADDWERVQPDAQYQNPEPANDDLFEYDLWLLAHSADGLAAGPVRDARRRRMGRAALLPNHRKRRRAERRALLPHESPGRPAVPIGGRAPRRRHEPIVSDQRASSLPTHGGLSHLPGPPATKYREASAMRIEDVGDLAPGSVTDADVCIVGSGPAGLVLAEELAQEGRRIFVLESGNLSPRSDADALNEIRSVGAPRVLDQGWCATVPWAERRAPGPVAWRRSMTWTSPPESGYPGRAGRSSGRR